MPDHATTFADLADLPARAELDLYETPARVTQALLRHERFLGPILEPCAGNGAIVRELRDAGHEVWAKDILERDLPLDEVVPFQMDATSCVNLVTNPPFYCINEFIKHALARTSDKVVILCPLATLTSATRMRIFQRREPARIYVIAERFGWIVGGVEHSSHYTNYCWIVWERFSQATHLRWMTL